MTRAAIEQYLYLLDEAFEGKAWHSVLANLASVRPDEWAWTPGDGRRTILTLVRELGECKHVYANHAFEDGSMAWNNPGSVPTIADGVHPEEAIEWLREAHRHLRSCVDALADDSELLRPRRANCGKEYETRWLIKTMIEHDLYHAGEINHIRALAQGND
jgi:hypothetical protein